MTNNTYIEYTNNLQLDFAKNEVLQNNKMKCT